MIKIIISRKHKKYLKKENINIKEIENIILKKTTEIIPKISNNPFLDFVRFQENFLITFVVQRKKKYYKIIFQDIVKDYNKKPDIIIYI